MSANLTESGHWYAQDGTPCYTQPYAGKREGERPTTLRDAKKLNLVPSVTTVEKIIAAPGLENWKARQVLLAAATLPRDPSWSDDEWISAVERDAREQAKNAADKGSAIHGAIELALRGSYGIDPNDGLPRYPSDYAEFIMAALEALDGIYETSDCVYWSPEESFTHPLGFGGKVDACLVDDQFSRGGIVVDFKTKEFTQDDIDSGKVKGWDNHARQLAAYREGLGLPRAVCANIFISVTQPGLAHVHEWTEDEIQSGWRQFKAALELWKALKGYDPAIN